MLTLFVTLINMSSLLNNLPRLECKSKIYGIPNFYLHCKVSILYIVQFIMLVTIDMVN